MDTKEMMVVKNVFEDETKIVVETTGVRQVFNKNGTNGAIDCYQLLNKERRISRIDFTGLSFTNTTIQKKDDSTCSISFKFKYEKANIKKAMQNSKFDNFKGKK